jgi:hypothetical protein
VVDMVTSACWFRITFPASYGHSKDCRPLAERRATCEIGTAMETEKDSGPLRDHACRRQQTLQGNGKLGTSPLENRWSQT